MEQDGPPPHLDQGHEEYPSATFDTEAAHSSPGVRVLQLPPPGYATAAPHSPHPHPPPPPPPHHFQPQHEQPHIHPTVIHHPVPAVPHVPVGNNPAGGTNFLSLPAIIIEPLTFIRTVLISSLFLNPNLRLPVLSTLIPLSRRRTSRWRRRRRRRRRTT